jgi:hypothetical protein
MKDLSCHILDIVQNSLHAGASEVDIEVAENTMDGTLALTITDNGAGMIPEVAVQVTDPFFTSSSNKKVGLGLPLLKQNAEQTGGSFEIVSRVNRGTVVKALFNTRSIDMIPAGDLALSMKTLIAAEPSKNFTYRQKKNEDGFELDTAVIRDELGGMNLGRREVLEFITNYIRDGVKELGEK